MKQMVVNIYNLSFVPNQYVNTKPLSCEYEL